MILPGDPEVFLTAWCTAGSGQKTSLGEPSNRWAHEAVADGGDGLKNLGFPRNHPEICEEIWDDGWKQKTYMICLGAHETYATSVVNHTKNDLSW